MPSRGRRPERSAPAPTHGELIFQLGNPAGELGVHWAGGRGRRGLVLCLGGVESGWPTLQLSL